MLRYTFRSKQGNVFRKGWICQRRKKDEITIRSSAAEYLTYVASIGGEDTSMEMRYEHENIWLTQKMMATLYDVSTSTINEHIMKIYADGEFIADEYYKGTPWKIPASLLFGKECYLVVSEMKDDFYREF